MYQGVLVILYRPRPNTHHRYGSWRIQAATRKDAPPFRMVPPPLLALGQSKEPTVTPNQVYQVLLTLPPLDLIHKAGPPPSVLRGVQDIYPKSPKHPICSVIGRTHSECVTHFTSEPP